MTMITPSYLGETIEYSSLHACRSTLEDPTNFYLYPSITSDPYLYWFGTVLPDFATDGAVGASVNAKSTWVAASSIQRYTQWGGLGT